MAEPVLFLETRTDAPVRVTCRLHLQFEKLGDLANVRAGFAERQETTPRIIFMNAEGAEPIRNAYVITKDMGAYLIQNVLAPDDITTAAEVTEVLKETATKYGWDLTAPWCGFTAPEEV
ncbi:hypothetical protein GOD54_23700 [Sinorhizobium medicae]|nr:hypothetical protein [Sinorhizobium medicae]